MMSLESLVYILDKVTTSIYLRKIWPAIKKWYL